MTEIIKMPDTVQIPEKPKVFLGIPCYGNQVNEGVIDAVACASKRGLVAAKQALNFSILTHTFNMLWASALNHRKTKGITHFALLHADIGPEVLWLDKMMDLMNEHGADVLSAVSPIKDDKGLTSTALDEPVGGHDPYWRVRRLSLHEIHKKFPGTFTHGKLLVNTGCMLVDLRKPWVEKICFRFENAMLPHPTVEGDFMPVVLPEDWAFSRDAKKLGAKLFATREVSLYHEGNIRFTNGEWGQWQTDKLI